MASRGPTVALRNPGPTWRGAAIPQAGGEPRFRRPAAYRLFSLGGSLGGGRLLAVGLVALFLAAALGAHADRRRLRRRLDHGQLDVTVAFRSLLGRRVDHDRGTGRHLLA